MIAITGGSGFIGREVQKRLIEAGRRVRIMSRSAHPVVEPESDKLVELFQGNLAESSPAELDSFLDDVDVLIHMAGKVSRDPADASMMRELHVEGTRKLLALASRNRVGRVILLSTSGVVGVSPRADVVADDDFPYAEELAARWPYYAGKIEQEQLAMSWAIDAGRELIALRPSLVLGPGDKDLSSTGDVLKFLLQRIPVIPPGGLSFVDVRDLAETCLKCIDIEIPDLRGNPRSYLLGAVNWTMAEFMETLAEVSGVKPPTWQVGPGFSLLGAQLASSALNPFRRWIDLDPVEADMANHYWYVKSDRAVVELGTVFHDPKKTLRDTVDYLRRTRDELRVD